MKRLANVKSRVWRAAHHFARKHDITWPFTVRPDAPDLTFTSTGGAPASVSISPLRLVYVNATLIWTGHPGIVVQGGSVTWATPNFIFTPSPGYTGPVSFTYTISDGRRRNTGNVTGTVS